MKKTFGIILITLLITSCSNKSQFNEFGTPHLGSKYDLKYREGQEKIVETKQDFKIPLQEGEFTKLANYTETNDLVVRERGVSFDYQLIFFE